MQTYLILNEIFIISQADNWHQKDNNLNIINRNTKLTDIRLYIVQEKTEVIHDWAVMKELQYCSSTCGKNDNQFQFTVLNLQVKSFEIEGLIFINIFRNIIQTRDLMDLVGLSSIIKSQMNRTSF